MAKSYDDYMLAVGYDRVPGGIPSDTPSIMPIFVPGLQVPGAINPNGPNVPPLQIVQNPPAGVVDYTDFTPDELVPEPIYALPGHYGQELQTGENNQSNTNLVDTVSTPLTGELRDRIIQQAFGEQPLSNNSSGTNWGLVAVVALGGIVLLNLGRK